MYAIALPSAKYDNSEIFIDLGGNWQSTAGVDHEQALACRLMKRSPDTG